jgi:hypothetical protein
MRSVDWRQVNWLGVIVHGAYVWVFGLALAYFGRLLGLDTSREFVPLLTVAVALATVFAAYRLAMRTGDQPLMHGFLVGLLVAGTGLILTLLTASAGVPEIAGFLMQLLGGLLGGRMAQQVQQGSAR